MFFTCLCLIAFFYNLGLRVFIEDEGIRNLVALEMIYSGNFILPTLNDTAYFSKPPLYNWVLIVFFKLTGVINEWTARIPNVLFLFAFTAVIYRYVSKNIDRTTGIFTALAFMTCGRILFWDSLLSFIDILYSLVTYAMLFHIYQKSKIGKWWSMYIIAYLLLATGYMLKGYPSVLFMGGGLISMAIVFRRWRALFHPAHLVGLLLCSVIIAIYFYYYDQYNAAENTFTPLLEQSTKRTILKHSLGHVFTHIFSYPFEVIYHFLPWTLLVIFTIRKGFWSILKSNSFIYFNVVAFLLNILVYWVSPEVYPRYILMLVPLLFTVFFYFRSQAEKGTWQNKIWDGLVQLIVYILPVVFVFLLTKYHHVLGAIEWVLMGLCILLSLANILFIRKTSLDRIYILVIACLLLRIVFNVVALPERHERDTQVDYKAAVIALGEKYKDEKISLYKGSKVDYTNSFYFSRSRGKKTKRAKVDFPVNQYYIYDTSRYEQVVFPYVTMDSFMVREHARMLYIIKRVE